MVTDLNHNTIADVTAIPPMSAQFGAVAPDPNQAMIDGLKAQTMNIEAAAGKKVIATQEPGLRDQLGAVEPNMPKQTGGGLLGDIANAAGKLAQDVKGGMESMGIKVSGPQMQPPVAEVAVKPGQNIEVDNHMNRYNQNLTFQPTPTFR